MTHDVTSSSGVTLRATGTVSTWTSQGAFLMESAALRARKAHAIETMYVGRRPADAAAAGIGVPSCPESSWLCLVLECA